MAANNTDRRPLGTVKTLGRRVERRKSANCLAQLGLALLVASTLAAGQRDKPQEWSNKKAPHSNSDDLLELAAAESAAQQQQVSAPTSHEILASGWPSTSPMWPSMEVEPELASGDRNETAAQPPAFIYADKPAKQDYSMLLSLNRSLVEFLTNSREGPQQQVPGDTKLGASLFFEYYFSHDPKVTALPGIKIELERKEFDYLEPSSSGGANGKRTIKTRMWCRYSKRISIGDAQQLEKSDWLKLSLVNRESPSLVAIRLLRVEFSPEGGAQPSPAEAPSEPPPEAPAGTSAPPPAADPTTASKTTPPSPTSPEAGPAPAVPETPAGPDPAQAPAAAAPPEGPEVDPNQAGQLDPGAPDQDQVPQASNALTSTIKPVQPKRSGWTSILGRRRRRKRQAPAGTASTPAVPATNNNNATAGRTLTLTCYQSNSCQHWRAEATGGTQIQWSLARMPPSTSAVGLGYFYASNRHNYGDQARPLLLWLNQTESATIVDQAADHCIDLALYVTERVHLKLYRALLRRNETQDLVGATSNSIDEQGEVGAFGGNWTRSSLVLTWAPTTTTAQARAHLEGAQLAASNQSGWTLETLCFGDFFERRLRCGLGECAFAFEMTRAGGHEPVESSSSVPMAGQELQPDGGQEANPPDETRREGASGDQQLEQVVGVALLRQYAVSVPNKQLRLPRSLETWQRPEVEPTDNWRFYPKLDYQIQADNVSLANLYDGALYSIQSDWVQQEGAHLNFEASFLVELDEELQGGGANGSQAAALPTAARYDSAGSPPSDRLFTLRVSRRIVDQENFATLHEVNSSIDWYEHYNNATRLALFNMSLPNLSELLGGENNEQVSRLEPSENNKWPRLFKMIIDIELDCHSSASAAVATVAPSEPPAPASQPPRFKLMLANVSLAERCFPNPCQFGTCQQNGTGPEDWQCQCDAQHRGRRCEFGRWCQLAHVAPPVVSQQAAASVSLVNANSIASNNQQREKIKLDNNFQLIILKSPAPSQSGTGGPAGPPAQTQQSKAGAQGASANGKQAESVSRVTGKEFCQRKLGAGSKCTEIDLPLNDRLYFDENETFTCTCQDDYYLSDDSKCRQAHQCNSIVCPHIGQICDETKPFNRTQPCHCNEKQDWYPASVESTPNVASGPSPPVGADRCVRRQCHDKQRDCGFDAHICLPTVPGERPICKCGPKFALKQNEKGQKYCQSTACVLPTLNDCQHICTPNDNDLQRPYTCSCHEGYSLDRDGRTCRPKAQSRAHGLHCKPACNPRTQICTEFGCKCRQGYVPESEIVIQVSPPPGYTPPPGANGRNSTSGLVNYVQSVRCLNVCSLSYAENKLEFERIESVCPLGLCEPSTFNCRCFDPNSPALVHTKYEPIWANETISTDEATSTSTPNESVTSPDGSIGPAEGSSSEEQQQVTNSWKKRASPLCHLKRVCQVDSAGYKLCRARGAICVPDYTRPAMFDCICPPSSEKRSIGPAGDFQCEPRCSSIRQECLKKQAVCRPIDKDQVRCDCLPGMMLDKHDERCYLAHYSYALNIIIVNKYYQPESRFHRAIPAQGDSSNATTVTSHNEEHQQQATEGQSSPQADHQAGDEFLQELMPQFQRSQALSSAGQAGHTKLKSMFITDYNQCNLTQLLPRSIIEDPYEHDMDTFLQYMEQCNEKIHQSTRTHTLNSRLSEDLRQSMRQHLREFTVTTNNSLCQELPMASVSDVGLGSNQISYLNCTIYLQSMEPIEETTINHIFTNCDKHGADGRLCWIKPRLLLMKNSSLETSSAAAATSGGGSQNASFAINPFKFRQIIPCEVNKFCGDDAHSHRLDDRTSMCSCKCPPDIEMIDLKELEPRSRALVPLIPTTTASSAAASLQGGGGGTTPQGHTWLLPPLVLNHRGAAVKEICAPRNHCGSNSTYCAFKIGSVCQYDIRMGSKCNCVYPSYEDNEGRCVEITFSQLDNTLIVILIMVGTCLIVSIALNLYALAKSKRGLFGHSKQYPMSEFSNSSTPVGRASAGGLSHRHPDDDDDDDDGSGGGAASAAVVTNRRHFGSTNYNHNGGLNRSTGMPNLAFDPND